MKRAFVFAAGGFDGAPVIRRRTRVEFDWRSTQGLPWTYFLYGRSRQAWKTPQPAAAGGDVGRPSDDFIVRSCSIQNPQKSGKSALICSARGEFTFQTVRLQERFPSCIRGFRCKELLFLRRQPVVWPLRFQCSAFHFPRIQISNAAPYGRQNDNRPVC